MSNNAELTKKVDVLNRVEKNIQQLMSFCTKLEQELLRISSQKNELENMLAKLKKENEQLTLALEQQSFQSSLATLPKDEKHIAMKEKISELASQVQECIDLIKTPA